MNLFKYYFLFFQKSKLKIIYLLLIIISLIFSLIWKYLAGINFIFISLFPSFIGVVFIVWFHKEIIKSNFFYVLINKNKNWINWFFIIISHYLLALLPVLINFFIYLNTYFINSYQVLNNQNTFLTSQEKASIIFLFFSSTFLQPLAYVFISSVILIFFTKKKWAILTACLFFIFHLFFSSTLIPPYFNLKRDDIFPLVYAFRIVSYFNPASYSLNILYLANVNNEGGVLGFNIFKLLNQSEMTQMGVYNNFHLIGEVLGTYFIIPATFILFWVNKKVPSFNLW